MDRRSFLKTSAFGGAAAAAAGGLVSPAVAQGKRKLTMVTSWGRGMAGPHDAAVYLADVVAAMSEGQLELDLKAAGELVGAFETFDAASSGQADMYHAADYYFINKHPAFAFYTTVPFGMTANELHDWYYFGGGQKLHHELGEIFNLRSFLAGNTGAQAGGWFRREIKGPEDFSGLKFRMPGLGGKVLGKLGASVQNIPGAEVYQALASGAIDGTEWIGPWADEKAGFQEITKFYYAAGFHEPGPGLSLAVNLDVFNSLTPGQQKMLEIACQAASNWNLSQFNYHNGAALQRLQAAGVSVLEYPDGVWDAFGKASVEVLEENMGDDIFKATYESALDSMRKSAAWFSTATIAYVRQRDRILKI
ncbi:MAG TPA: twin-arginine translocation signal domain-containing protein [Paracoccaceae bacterium]|nr:twin-arginine translocation signal domain-containing protein [Paracoccaceae bacterium]